MLLEAFLSCAHQQPCCSLSFRYHPWQLGTKVVSVQSSETILCMPSMILSSKNQNTNHILSMLTGRTVHVPNGKPLSHTCMQTRPACSSPTHHVIRAFFTKDAAMAFFRKKRSARGKDQSKLCCVLEHMSLLVTLLGLGVLVEVKVCWTRKMWPNLTFLFILLSFFFPFSFKTCNLCMCRISQIKMWFTKGWVIGPINLGWVCIPCPKVSSNDIFYFLNIDRKIVTRSNA